MIRKTAPIHAPTPTNPGASAGLRGAGPSAPWRHADRHGPQGSAAGELPLTPLPDLRRRDRRGQGIDLLVSRADALAPADRALILAVYRDGLPVSEVVGLLQLGRRRSVAVPIHAVSVRRRLRSLVRHLLSPRFVYVWRHAGSWGPSRRRVAEICILQDRPMRDAAVELGLSAYQVRHHRHAVDALLEAAGL